jgi:hypothetical protein
MKLFGLLPLLFASSVVAQSVVDFNNNRAFVTPADRLVYTISGPNQTPLVGTNYVAQLYYGADATSLVPVTSAPARFRLPTTTAPGTWSGGNRTLTGFTPGTTATLMVVAWDSTFGSTFDQARAAGAWYAQSSPFTYTIPAAGSPPAFFYMENFRAFACIPEPSAVLLFISALSIVCLRRRAAGRTPN